MEPIIVINSVKNLELIIDRIVRNSLESLNRT
jgi:hypothetical protein